MDDYRYHHPTTLAVTARLEHILKYGMLENVGIELEFEHFSQRDAQYLQNRGLEVNIVHDASIETDVIVIDGLYVERSPVLESLGLSTTATIGAEITTIPLKLSDLDKVRNILEQVVEFSRSRGETPQSSRSSLHIHISMPLGIDILKQEIRLGRAYEDLFFRLGCMGYTHRGMVVNEFAYCRPITKWGPPIVRSYKGGLAKSFDLDLLEKTKDVGEYFYSMCDSYRGDRYVPQRYVWLNQYSHLSHETLEFRVFNKCMNPAWILATILLCKEFCRRAIVESFENKVYAEHSAFTPRDTPGLHQALDEFSLDKETMMILHSIIDKSPAVVIPNRYLRTHLRSYLEPWRDEKPETVSVSEEDVHSISVMDIHTLRGER